MHSGQNQEKSVNFCYKRHSISLYVNNYYKVQSQIKGVVEIEEIIEFCFCTIFFNFKQSTVMLQHHRITYFLTMYGLCTKSPRKFKNHNNKHHQLARHHIFLSLINKIQKSFFTTTYKSPNLKWQSTFLVFYVKVKDISFQ